MFYQMDPISMLKQLLKQGHPLLRGWVCPWPLQCQRMFKGEYKIQVWASQLAVLSNNDKGHVKKLLLMGLNLAMPPWMKDKEGAAPNPFQPPMQMTNMVCTG